MPDHDHFTCICQIIIISKHISTMTEKLVSTVSRSWSWPSRYVNVGKGGERRKSKSWLKIWKGSERRKHFFKFIRTLRMKWLIRTSIFFDAIGNIRTSKVLVHFLAKNTFDVLFDWVMFDILIIQKNFRRSNPSMFWFSTFQPPSVNVTKSLDQDWDICQVLKILVLHLDSLSRSRVSWF